MTNGLLPNEPPVHHNRRGFVRTLVLLAVGLPAPLLAQIGEPHQIGMLFPGLERSPRNIKMRQAFENRLRELGYVEGRTIRIHYRYAEGVLDRLPALARELVTLKVEAIVAVTAAATDAAHNATADVPIVMVHAGNPIGSVIASLARPGGNVTGTTSMLPELGGKQVEILHEVFPAARRIAFLAVLSNSGTSPMLRSASTADQALGLELIAIDVAERKDFDTAFARIEQSCVYRKCDSTSTCGDLGCPSLQDAL